MPSDRSHILREELRVETREVYWHFIADYYDGPISGLALFRGQIWRFCCFAEDIPEQHIYVLQELTKEELVEDLRVKEKFEAFVSTHWSFDRDGKRLSPVVREKELSKRFYKEEKIEFKADPLERPVIAWFDLRK